MTAMGAYERVGARPRPGGGRASTLGRAPMGSNMIHGPTGQNRATEHLDRFWTSTSFDDSRRLRYYFDMRPVPSQALSNYLSNHIKNVPNGLRMRSWHPLQLCLVVQSESSVQKCWPWSLSIFGPKVTWWLGGGRVEHLDLVPNQLLWSSMPSMCVEHPCVSGLSGLFRGTEVVKQPFYSIGPKLMFGSVS
jgi:hypothetical protein